MKYARIFDNKCSEIISFNPEGKYAPSIKWVPVEGPFSNYVKRGYILDDGILKPPSLEVFQDQLLEESASLRYFYENQSIETNGITISVNRASRGELLALMQTFELGFKETLNWKLSNRKWITITKTEFTSVVSDVLRYVNTLFSIEKGLCEAILNCKTFDELLEIDVKDHYKGYGNELS